MTYKLQKYILPSITGRGWGVGLLFLLFLGLNACSSDDEANNGNSSTFESAQAPKWEVDMHSDQAKPQWTSPTPRLYESKMILMMRLQEELVPYSTDDDLMAVFIGDECRAISQRSGNDAVIYFVLNTYGNSTSEPEQFAVCYYSGGLHQEFWLRGENIFLDETNVGTESDIVLDFLSGTTKYARQTVFIVNPKAKEGITINNNADLVGVFVNGECRGVGKPGVSFNVFHQPNETQAELRYYSSSQGGIYTRSKPLTLDTGYQTIDFNF